MCTFAGMLLPANAGVLTAVSQMAVQSQNWMVVGVANMRQPQPLGLWMMQKLFKLGALQIHNKHQQWKMILCGVHMCPSDDVTLLLPNTAYLATPLMKIS